METKFEEEFKKAALADPTLVTKMLKLSGKQEFIEKYNLLRATQLRCPICSQPDLGAGGVLWLARDGAFTCRRCKETIEINFGNTSIGQKTLEEVEKLIKSTYKFKEVKATDET